MYTVFGDPLSGNCHKVRLVLEHLRLAYEWKDIGVTTGETGSSEFRAMNPVGQVPVLALPNGEYLSQSNAIMHYLAHGSELLPADPIELARVLEWLYFEQYSHEPVIATVRFWIYYLDAEDEYADKIAECRPKGYAALDVMEQHLKHSSFLAAGRYTIADAGLFAYTHVAHQGKYDLSAYPAIRDWLARVEAQPGFVPMGE
ncbi:MAG: glutathione S-transferase family protein [Pseudomonadota bacterium]